jgi:hypothetical protein
VILEDNLQPCEKSAHRSFTNAKVMLQVKPIARHSMQLILEPASSYNRYLFLVSLMFGMECVLIGIAKSMASLGYAFR